MPIDDRQLKRLESKTHPGLGSFPGFPSVPGARLTLFLVFWGSLRWLGRRKNRGVVVPAEARLPGLARGWHGPDAAAAAARAKCHNTPPALSAPHHHPERG